MSEIMKEMSETLLRNPEGVPSSEAARVALFFANVAWNESVWMNQAREGYRNAWEKMEADNPALWNEFKSNDINAMIGKIRVEWLSPAAPGVDSKQEMRLYGLVRTGERGKAIQFLRETRRMSRDEASRRVAQIAAELGMKWLP